MNRRNFLTTATAVASSSIISQSVSADEDLETETEIVADVYVTDDGCKIGTLMEQDAEWICGEFQDSGAFFFITPDAEDVSYETDSVKSVYCNIPSVVGYLDEDIDVWTEDENGNKISDRVVFKDFTERDIVEGLVEIRDYTKFRARGIQEDYKPVPSTDPIPFRVLFKGRDGSASIMKHNEDNFSVSYSWVSILTDSWRRSFAVLEWFDDHIELDADLDSYIRYTHDEGWSVYIDLQTQDVFYTDVDGTERELKSDLPWDSKMAHIIAKKMEVDV